MSQTVSVEIIFKPKTQCAGMYDFRNFALILSYGVEDAFMPLGISFYILSGEKYKSDIQQWMNKFSNESYGLVDPWTSAIVEVPSESVEEILLATERAEHHPEKDNIIGEVFTKIFPNFPE